MYLTEITQISALAAQINSINFTLKGSPVQLVDLRQTPDSLTPLEVATCVVKLNVSHEIMSSVSLSLGTLQTFGNNFVPFVYIPNLPVQNI